MFGRFMGKYKARSHRSTVFQLYPSILATNSLCETATYKKMNSGL